MIYTPGFIDTSSSELLLQNLTEELYRIQRAIETSSSLATSDFSFTEPTRPQPLQCVFADGVKWDPGKGAGYYIRIPVLDLQGKVVSSDWKKVKFEED